MQKTILKTLILSSFLFVGNTMAYDDDWACSAKCCTSSSVPVYGTGTNYAIGYRTRWSCNSKSATGETRLSAYSNLESKCSGEILASWSDGVRYNAASISNSCYRNR